MDRLISIALVLSFTALSAAQVGGGSAGYAQQGNDKERIERSHRSIAEVDIPPPGTSYVDASVLANVKADEYVAVFGIVQDGATLKECEEKMTSTLSAFLGFLKQLGVEKDDVFVDFILQNRIYAFDVADNVAKERLAGFELKKNVSIHYKRHAILDQIVNAAASAQVFDLIKVDYIVRDTLAVRTQLLKEAAAIIKRKVANAKSSTGLSLTGPSQIIVERYVSYSPTEMYDSYTAAEGDQVTFGYDRSTTQRVRKPKTFYFNPLDAKLFDKVIDPVILEPVVQFTLYYRVKYDVSPAKAVARPKKKG